MSIGELLSASQSAPQPSLSVQSAEIVTPELADLQGAGVKSDSAMTAQLSYALITPARNEEAFIEKTIESMLNQTLLPVKWVIVDDASTDKTHEIVSRYLGQHLFRQRPILRRHQIHDSQRFRFAHLVAA